MAVAHSDRLPFFLGSFLILLTLAAVYRDAVWNPRVREMRAGIRDYQRGWWLPWRR